MTIWKPPERLPIMNPFHTKTMWSLLDQLFADEIRRYWENINKLINENDALQSPGGPPSRGFDFRGQLYGRNESLFNQRFAHNLHPSLMVQTATLLQTKTNLDNDKKLINQVLHREIMLCDSDQDLRDLLPETLVILDPYLSKMARRREPGWAIPKDQANKMRIHQFQKITTKIEMYAAMRFLY